MLNLKLKAIANYVKKDDIVIDTCTDHAYLAIYLKKQQLCQEVYASDINPHALKIAKKNIFKAQVNIPTFLSDGFKNIPDLNINTAIIAGVGAHTILNIIDSAPQSINKFIISSNNDYAYLRTSLYKQKLYIKEEIVVYEKNKYYPIMLVLKAKVKESKLTLKYGKINNKAYYEYLLSKEKDILTKIPFSQIFKRQIYKRNINNLKKIIKRNSAY